MTTNEGLMHSVGSEYLLRNAYKTQMAEVTDGQQELPCRHWNGLAPTTTLSLKLGRGWVGKVSALVLCVSFSLPAGGWDSPARVVWHLTSVRSCCGLFGSEVEMLLLFCTSCCQSCLVSPACMCV